MKNKRILMIAALLIALALPLFAVQATVDWQWEMNDPDVQYFRYQLDELMEKISQDEIDLPGKIRD